MTLQQLSEVFAKSNGVPKKTSEIFVKYLFDTVEEGLLADGVVKVKGWGTFKLVDIGARESISVSTGERVLIPGYKKVTFIPEDILLGTENEKDIVISEESENEIMVANVEGVDKNVEQKSEREVCSDLDNKLNEDVILPDVPEQKNDDFSGIDLLISTPECIEGAKEDLWKARNVATTMRAKAEQAINLAKNAEREVLRLEALIENLENNNSVEVRVLASDAINLESNTVETENSSDINDATCEMEHRHNVTNVNSDSERGEEVSCGDEERKNKKKWFWALLLIFFVLICITGYYWFFVHAENVDPSEDVVVETKDEMTIEEPIVEVTLDTTLLDSLSVSEKTDTSAINETATVGVVDNIEKESLIDKENTLNADTVQQDLTKSYVKQESSLVKPDKYVLKEGETLTMLARRFYGSPDYVVDIINANNFSDPDNVHVGAIVVLP